MLFLLSSLIADSVFLNFSAGQDLMTRIWSISSGELLHYIPFPEKVDKSENPIPALYYSDAFGGRGGMPGLLQGAGESIYFYSFWNAREPSLIFVQNRNEKKEMWFCSGTMITGESFPPPTPLPPLQQTLHWSTGNLSRRLRQFFRGPAFTFLPIFFYLFANFELSSARIGKERQHFLPFSLRAVHRFVVVLVVVFCCDCDFRPTTAMKGNPAPLDIKRFASK